MVEAPKGDCPKCGYEMAFTHDWPRYRERSTVKEYPTKGYADTIYEEYLGWPCHRCGYEEETKTKDAQ